MTIRQDHIWPPAAAFMLDYGKDVIQQDAYLDSLPILALDPLLGDLTTQFLGSDSNADSNEPRHWTAVLSNLRPGELLLSRFGDLRSLTDRLICVFEFAKKAALSSSSATTACTVTCRVIVLEKSLLEALLPTLIAAHCELIFSNQMIVVVDDTFARSLANGDDGDLMTETCLPLYTTTKAC